MDNIDKKNINLENLRDFKKNIDNVIDSLNKSVDYDLPIATTETLGGVKVDGATITADADGIISAVTCNTVTESTNGLATPDLLSKATNAVPKSGTTMTGALVGQSNTEYTTAQFRNITMSTSAPSGGSNGQVHFQYS